MGCSPLISSLCQLLLKPICHKGRGVGGEAKKGRDKSSGGTVGERGGGGSPMERGKNWGDRE